MHGSIKTKAHVSSILAGKNPTNYEHMLHVPKLDLIDSN